MVLVVKGVRVHWIAFAQQPGEHWKIVPPPTLVSNYHGGILLEGMVLDALYCTVPCPTGQRIRIMLRSSGDMHSVLPRLEHGTNILLLQPANPTTHAAYPAELREGWHAQVVHPQTFHFSLEERSAVDAAIETLKTSR